MGGYYRSKTGKYKRITKPKHVANYYKDAKYKYANTRYRNTIREIGISNELLVKLPYTETIVQTDNAASNLVQFSSSAYDPNQTGVGHQLRYYDQWAALFNRYQVLAVKATIEFISVDASPMPVACAINWSENGDNPGGIDNVSETKYGKRGILQGPGAQTVLRMNTYMTAKRIHGSNRVTSQDDEQALVNANPNDMFFLNIVNQSIDALTTTQVYKRVTLLYYVRFFDQKDPGAS